MTLYEIDYEIRAFLDSLMEAVDENGEIVEQEVDVDKLAELNAARDAKLDNIACWIKNLEADAVAIKAEEKALKERRERAEHKAERLKKLLADSMQAAGEDKFSSARCAISFRKSNPVVIDNFDALADEYKKEKIEISADKAKIKEAIKAGNDVAGAHIEEVKNIQIK